MITEVIHRYHPEWDPPKERNRAWEPCLCPFHADETPSAAVSYVANAFICHACGVKGDFLAIIRQQEGVSFEEAVRISASISPWSSNQLPPVSGRKPRRRVFAEQGDLPDQRPGEKVPSRIRGRTTPWE